MNYTEIAEYFENLARQHVAVKHTEVDPHFFRINLEDIISGLKNHDANPAVFLELPEARIHGETSDNSFLSRYCAVTFMKKVPPDDRVAEIEAYDNMEALGIDFMSRLNRDYKNFSNRLIKEFDYKNIPIYKVGPMMHSMYGMRFEISIGEPATNFMIYNPANWLDS
jgi:hypothetical protein